MACPNPFYIDLLMWLLLLLLLLLLLCLSLLSFAMVDVGHGQTEFLLQHAGIEDAHVVVHDREGEQMTVSTFTVSGQRADAKGMGQRSRFAAYQAFKFRVAEFRAQRAVHT